MAVWVEGTTRTQVELCLECSQKSKKVHLDQNGVGRRRERRQDRQITGGLKGCCENFAELRSVARC